MSAVDGIRAELARAKVNLTLHVGRVISDGQFKGYHPVDSLVVFADFGDSLSFTFAESAGFEISGPFSNGLEGGADNLVSKALNLSQTLSQKTAPQKITLVKNIPVSAGLGGGSANAAAVLRVLDTERHVNAAELGADVPVCRVSQTALMQGIGETVTPLPNLGQLQAILVNPLQAVSTGAIFKAFDSVPRAVCPDENLSSGSLLERARAGRNDLQSVAVKTTPVIASVLSEISGQAGCEIARMSGSGASCFGLFETEDAARSAAIVIKKSHPEWWVKACRLGDPS